MFRSDPDPFFEKEEYDQNPDYKYVKKKHNMPGVTALLAVPDLDL